MVLLIFGRDGERAFVLSNESKTIRVYDHPSALIKTINIGSGEWVDISVVSNQIWLLDASGTSKVKTIASSAWMVEDDEVTLTPVDWETLSSGEWFSIAVTTSKVYVLGKLVDMDNPEPDFVVQVYSDSKVRLTDEDKNLFLDADFTAMSINGNDLEMLIGNAGIRMGLDITSATESLVKDRDASEIMLGTVGWVGLDYSSVSGRQGFYALQNDGTRVLGFTDGGRRNSEDDYQL